MLHCQGIWLLFKKYLAVFSEAWKARKSLETPSRRKDEQDFLPAHLELIETPVSALPR